MKPINYLGYTIRKIERAGHRRVTIYNGYFIVDSLDGSDMVKLVKEAKKLIDKLVKK